MNILKLYIYFEIVEGPWGGGTQFLKAFRKYINNYKKGQVQMVEYIDEEYDIFLMNSGYRGPGSHLDMQIVEHIKKYGYTKLKKRLFRRNPGKKIVHRLDGLRAVYNKQWDEMDELQLQASRLADHIIFQSKHCLESFRKYGYNGNNYSIVYNGVDQSIFNTHEKEFWNGTDKLKIFSCNWSSNPRKGYSIIANFSEIEGVESYFVGRWPKEIDQKKVISFPPMTQKELANYYRKCDVFLHGASDDPCPNVVLEALSCGLPVFYHNSGGTSEIARKYGLPLPEDITTEAILDLVEMMKKSYPQFVENIKNDMKIFSIERAAEEYLNIFYNLTWGD